MTRTPAKLLVAVLFLACSSTAFGQFFETWFSAGQSLLSNASLGSASAFGGSKNDYALTDGFRFGFRMTFNTTGIIGHEVGYFYNRTHLRDNTNGGLETGMA